MTILFTGDTFLQTKDGSMPFPQSIIDLFASFDDVCINLETTIGVGGKKIAKAFNFQTDPAMLDYAKSVGVNVVSVANNHSMDYSQEGFEETLNNVHKREIKVIGATVENCCQVKGCDVTYCISSYYGVNDGRWISPLNINKIIDDIKIHKRENDFLIVCLHWGEEYSAYPKPSQQSLAHKLIDAGANVIIGHHPHVMQGIEKYHGGLIFYSLGNFNFFVDHPWAKKLVETTKSYCVSLELERGNKPEYKIVPITIKENWQPSVITDTDERKRFFDYLDKISEPLPKNVKRVFYVAQAAPHYFHNHLPSWKKRIKQFGFSHFVQFIKWIVSPGTCINYLGLVASLFIRRPKY